MDFIISSIVSGIMYDLISRGVKVTFSNVFGKFNNSIYSEDVINLLDEINSNIASIKNEKDVEMIVEAKPNYIHILNQLTYSTEFARRLDYVMSLMNLARHNKSKLNIDSLSKWIGFNSSNDIKKYYTGKDEPSFEFEQQVAEKLGINIDWIQTGNSAPFRSILSNNNRAWDILNQSNIKSVDKFLFLSSRERRLYIIEKFDKYKYLFVPHPFVFNSCVGCDGASELASLYSVLKQLKKDGYKVDSGVYEISDNDDFYSFEDGNHHPLEYLNKGKYISYIIDDFIDLYSNEEVKQNYISYYGEDFVKIQDIVRSRL